MAARSARGATVLLAVTAGALLVALTARTKSPTTRTDASTTGGHVRHARSTIVALVNYGTPDGALWAYRTSEREIWIAPDGSGRIVELTTSLELVDPYTQQDWEAAGKPDKGDMAENFPPGGLSYVSRADALSALERVGTSDSAPGDALRMLASVLAETAPSSATIARATEIARQVPGVGFESKGDRLSFTGDTQGGKVNVTLKFDTSQGRLVSEVWRSTSEESQFDLTTPYLLFSRSMELEEELPAWSREP